MTRPTIARPVGTPTKRRGLVRLAIVTIIVLLATLGVEVGARVVYANKDRLVQVLPGLLDLHEYQVLDRRHPGHWRLRAGFVESRQEAPEASKPASRIAGQQYIADTMRHQQVFVRVNSDGFRGPEIDKTHSLWRILTIGDSGTFGSSETHNYPRSLERNLTRLGRDVEVINGGVEGYSPRNVLFRINEYKALQPEITTIELGWTDLYSETSNPHAAGRTSFYSLRLFGQVYGILERTFRDRTKAALGAHKLAKHVDARAPELKYLDGYAPPFLINVEQIVDELRDAHRQVVLITLPGLFTTDEVPSARALEVGHLPPFTDNPYFLARMAAQYNDGLRSLAERKHVPLIDLDGWSKTALQPRDKYFLDSVHLCDEAQERVGAYMAEQLQLLVPIGPRHEADGPVP